MADLKATHGQYIPLARNQTLSYVPSSYATTPRAGYGDAYKGQSFHDVLNRTQLTSAQLKSMQAPNNIRTSAKPAASGTTPSVSSSPTFIPNPNSPYNQKLLQETNQHIQNIPPVVPKDEVTDQLILSNMQEYANQKAASKSTPLATTQAATSEPPLQQVPVGNSPVNNSNSMSAEDTTILNAILAKNAINPSSVNTQPASSTVTPPVSVETSPALPEIVTQEAPVQSSSLSGFPAYIPVAKITQRSTATPVLENTPVLEPMIEKQETSLAKLASREENAEESSEPQSAESSHPNNGFFNAIGSFFGNIASAVTLGFYRPANDPEPTGFARVIDPFKKIVWDAPKSIIVDAPVGAYHDLNSGEEKATSNNTRTIAMNTETNSSRTARHFGHSRTSLRRNYYS